MQESGCLRADVSYVEETFLPAYAWMAEQMAARVGPKPPPVEYPVWCWHQWNDEQQKKPDLRFGSHLSRGERGVRIEFEIEPELVLLSDFELWHHVLNYWYLPSSERDSDDFEAELAANGLSLYAAKPLPNLTYHQRITASWQRIFELDWIDEEGYITSRSRGNKAIQGTFWELPMENVKRVKEFTAR